MNTYLRVPLVGIYTPGFDIETISYFIRTNYRNHIVLVKSNFLAEYVIYRVGARI